MAISISNIYVCLPVSLCLSVSLSLCLSFSLCLSVIQSLYLFVSLSLCLSVSLSLCLLVSLSLCLSLLPSLRSYVVSITMRNRNHMNRKLLPFKSMNIFFMKGLQGKGGRCRGAQRQLHQRNCKCWCLRVFVCVC